MNDLKAEFAKLAVNGYLGDPNGADSYAYLRASSERQVEEGSSFPRQLESIKKAARRDKLRIPFELVFFDDGFTGFEFEHRPALLKLRHEQKTKPRAQHVVFEDIDRLSRNADWQQGFLLEEFARHHIQVHFYMSPGSQLERYVRGYIAQEGMKKDIERMKMGNLYKAMDGRVTARRPRYGYIKTDPKNSHYELHPEESKVMRWVYEKIIYDRWTLHQIAKWMNDNQVPTRFKTGFWTASTLYQMVTSPVYKGEFYANQNYHVKTGEFNSEGRPKRTNRKRPSAEWIRVDVPAIVTPEEWQLAQDTLAQNAKRATRNAKKYDWLLQGFLKCDICKSYTFLAIVGNTNRNPRRYYGCSSRSSEKARKLGTSCRTPYVCADFLERRVWEEIEDVIYNPDRIIRRMEERKEEERKKGYEEQIAYVDSQLADLAKEREKLEAAYKRDIYTLDEFESKMKDLRGKANTLESSKAKLQTQMTAMHSIETQKRVVLAGLDRIRAEVERAKREGRPANEIPVSMKRKLLGLIVDVIWVNSRDETFTIQGEIKGTFAFGPNSDDSKESPKSGGGGGGFGFASGLKWRRCEKCLWRERHL
ncbi:recombinase family protein [Candidatus Kaiserbacteria bacterium]|nr:recombinase family protein [Candidatus Kaiserbacteria bacterium]